MILHIITVSLSFGLVAFGLTAAVDDSTELSHDTTRIHFGSCVWPEAPQNIWKAAIDRNPDLWIWTGDATYLDYKNFDMFSDLDIWKQLLFYKFQPGDPKDYKTIWQKTYENSDYKKLETMCPIIGVWDDHDYGMNNGNYDNPNKQLTQELFLDFLNVDPKDPRRKRDGVYDFYQLSVTFPQNKSINQPKTITKTIDIIMLDVRSHWGEDSNKPFDMLGETQWKWFENIINNKLSGDLTLIVSGIQILSKNKPYSEQWGLHHWSQQRLLTYLLSNHKGNKLFYDHTILISGDQHWGEVAHVTCISEDSDLEFKKKHQIDETTDSKHKHHSKYRPTRDLYEITSSGLTHSIAGNDAPFFLRNLMNYYQILETDKITQCMLNSKNFGEIEISWEPKFQENSENKVITDYVIDDIFMKIFDENGNLGCNIKYPIYDHSLIEYEEEEMIDFKDQNHLLYEIDTSEYDGIYSKYHCYSYHPISDFMFFIQEYILLATIILFLLIPVGLISIGLTALSWCCSKTKAKTKQKAATKNTNQQSKNQKKKKKRSKKKEQ